MKSYPAKFKSFQRKIVQMGASLKLQNSIQILTILWLVYPIHTNSLFQVIFEKLPFCHFPPLNTSILGKDSQIQLIFHLNILVFQTNGKQPRSFAVLSRFCNCLWRLMRGNVIKDPFSLTVMHRGRFVVSGTQKVAIRVSSFSGGEICFHLNSLFML